MHIYLSDIMVKVENWDHIYDSFFAYNLKVRKTPEEMKAARAEAVRKYGKAKKIAMTYKEPGTVLSVDASGTAYFLPGLWPRFSDKLAKDKVEYEFTDQREPSLRPEPDYSRLAGIELRMGQDVTLALLCMSDCGIIECGTGYGKSFIIAQLCKILPTLNIMICTRSSQVVATLYDYINKELWGEVGYLYQKGDTSSGKRIVVTTAKSMSRIPPEHVQLLLFDECHDVGANTTAEDLSKFLFCRRFGFSASPIRNDGSGIVMEALFGPVIQQVDYAMATAAGMVTPMKYIMMPCFSGPGMLRDIKGDDGRKHRKDMPDHIRKRYSYWCNTSRNKVIADAVYNLKKVTEAQILIMVESLEHAIRLHQLLPWFKVAHCGADDVAKYNDRKDLAGINMSQYKLKGKELDIMRHAYEKGTLRYVISTTTWRQGCNFPNLSILIRADARISKVDGLQIPGRLARLADGKEFGYLIDVGDQFSEWSSERSYVRKSTYDEQQWQEATLEEAINDLKGAVFGGMESDPAWSEGSGDDGPDVREADGGESGG